jgi:hypothetical protein
MQEASSGWVQLEVRVNLKKQNKNATEYTEFINHISVYSVAFLFRLAHLIAPVRGVKSEEPKAAFDVSHCQLRLRFRP